MDEGEILALLLLAGVGVYMLNTQASMAEQTAQPPQPQPPQPYYPDFPVATDYTPETQLPDWLTPTLPDIPVDTGGDIALENIEEPVGAEIIPAAANANTFAVNEYPKYADAIAQAETAYGLPTNLLAKLLYQESRYRKEIISGALRSRAGATGIAQFMPRTAAYLGVDPLDPIASINGAAGYLAKLYGMFGNWPYAVAAYNWGPGNLRKYLNGTISMMPAETQTYVASIAGSFTIV